MATLRSIESGAAKEPLNSSGSSPHDSMVTVRLSEPMLSKFGLTSQPQKRGSDPDLYDGSADDPERMSFVPVSQTVNFQTQQERFVQDQDLDMDDSDKDTIYEGNAGPGVGSMIAMDTEIFEQANVRRGSGSSGSSVNWESLERTEEQEPRNQDTEDVS